MNTNTNTAGRAKGAKATTNTTNTAKAAKNMADWDMEVIKVGNINL